MADDTKQLLETAMAQVKALGEQFPNGIASLQLEIDAPSRVTLKVAGVQAGAAASATADDDDDFVTPTFNSEGHHVVGYITRADLEANHPATFARVQAILDAVDRTWESAATFPDDIKSAHPETKPFHFIDIVFEEGGPQNPPLPAAPHVLSKMEEFTDFLSAGGGSDQDKADAVSWLIHLFGDVHQPLHCIERVNAFNPSGDKGGNRFKLKGRPNNLHSLWDSSVSVLQNVDEQVLAESIRTEIPRSSLATALAISDPEAWARASHQIARSKAYGPLEENPNSPPRPSKVYLKSMESIGRRQAALAGYRLADRFAQIFP